MGLNPSLKTRVSAVFRADLLLLCNSCALASKEVPRPPNHAHSKQEAVRTKPSHSPQYTLALGEEPTACDSAWKRRADSATGRRNRSNEGSGSRLEQHRLVSQIAGKDSPVIVPQPAGQTLSSCPGLLKL